MNILKFNAENGVIEVRGMTDDEISETSEYSDSENIQFESVAFVSALDLWTRLTDEEAVTVKQAMANQPFRIQKIFETAQTFREDHELWPLLQGMAVVLFGTERAGEILAPSN